MSNSLKIYEAVREQMKTGDCISFASNDLLGKLIRIWSKGSNHIESILCLSKYAGKENRIWSLGARSGGIDLNILSNLIKNYNGQVTWYPVKDEFDWYRETVVCKGLKVAGTPYDFEGLFANVFGRISMAAKKFLCSKFWYWLWMKGADEEYPNGVLPKVEKVPRPGDIIKDPWKIFKTPMRLA